MDIADFKKIIWTYYKKHTRDLLWRKTRDPYKILVSEIMLQQTQSQRVEPKYKSFIQRFPTIRALAEARLQDVLREWQGLGYNRRAIFLHRCAQKIISDFKGKIPKDVKALCSLPGIGKATAGDVLAFAWDIPTVFIETNIRTVFIHFFFSDKDHVSDAEIMLFVEKTLDQKNPREWYWALFDYGVFLKKTANLGRKSAHYAKQSVFVGSFRQKRAQVLRLIVEKPRNRKEVEQFVQDDELAERVIQSLEKDKFIKKIKNTFYII